MKRIARVLAGVVVGCGLGVAAERTFADVPAAPVAEQQAAASSMPAPVAKLGRGAGNFLLGWEEIPLAIHEQRAASNDKVANFFSGTVLGFGKGIARTAVGAFEVVTFPLPIPENYGPILPTLRYFDRTNRERLPLD